MFRDRFVSPAVQMLLERMNTHPEEFMTKTGTLYSALSKWHDVLHEGKWHDVLHEGGYNTIEKYFLKRKYEALKRKATQEKIMTILLHGEDEMNETKEQLTQLQSTVSRFSSPLQSKMIVNKAQMEMLRKAVKK